MKSYLIRILVISVLLNWPLHLFADFNFVISPPIVKLKLHQGSTEKVLITIFNEEDKSLNLEIQMTALGMDLDGRAIEGDEKYEAFSCAGWLSTPEARISIAPHESIQVPVQINVPYGVNGGKYAIVLFSTIENKANSSDLIISGRMGSIFMIELFGKKVISGKIEAFKIVQETSGIGMITLIKNTGNIHLTVKGSVIIKNDKLKIIDRVKIDTGTGTILPNDKKRFTTRWSNKKKMKPGEYTAILRIRVPGMGKMLQMDQPFKIIQ